MKAAAVRKADAKAKAASKAKVAKASGAVAFDVCGTNVKSVTLNRLGGSYANLKT